MTPKPPKDPWPGVAGAELTVIKCLWEHGPGTVRALQTRLQHAGQDWAYTTVQTLLGRLVEKGYAAVDRAGQAHSFRAAVTRDDLAEQRIDELADSLLDGVVAPLVLRLVQKGKLSRDELARCRALLEAAEARQRGRS